MSFSHCLTIASRKIARVCRNSVDYYDDHIIFALCNDDHKSLKLCHMVGV